MRRPKYWLMADTHFGHTAIKKYENRPDDCDERMLHSITQDIDRLDTFIHLGDICIGNDELWNNKLLDSFGFTSTTKILVRGNHDKKTLTWYKKNGWSVVCDRLDLNIYGKRIALSHVPLPDNGDFDINVHGHLHGSYHRPEIHPILTDKHRLVCMEHSYQSILLENIL